MKGTVVTPQLPRQSTDVLLHGRYASRIGGNSLRRRARNLLVIASAYSRQELLCERGIGVKSADAIETWLHAHGLALRED